MTAENPHGEAAIPGNAVKKKEQATPRFRKVSVNELVSAEALTDFSVHYSRSRRGDEMPLHIHERYQDTVYITSGHTVTAVAIPT